MSPEEKLARDLFNIVTLGEAKAQRDTTNSHLQDLKRLLQQSQAEGPPCPHCGGGLPKVGVSVCMHCQRDVVWVGDSPCIPGQEVNLRRAKAELERKQEREREREREREQYRRQEILRLEAEDRERNRKLRDSAIFGIKVISVICSAGAIIAAAVWGYSEAMNARKFAREWKSVQALENSIGMEMNLLRKGKFESNLEEVVVSEPFYIGVFEVTQTQYEHVMTSNPSRFVGPQHPVEHVTWFDAVEFCNTLSALPAEKAAGRVYRLPTETEWEYACGAGSTTKFSFGDNESLLREYSWYEDNSGTSTHPVGQKKANAWGLYDMHANVWEWCSDLYTNKTSRILRGGSWRNDAAGCGTTNRNWEAPSKGLDSIGFRVVMTSPEIPK